MNKSLAGRINNIPDVVPIGNCISDSVYWKLDYELVVLVGRVSWEWEVMERLLLVYPKADGWARE